MSYAIQTVLGDIHADQAGIALTHEHLFIDLWQESRRAGLLDDPDVAVAELRSFQELGGGLLVDCSNDDFGRRPADLVDVSRRTGLHVVMSTGHYRDPYIDRHAVDRKTVDEIAQPIIDEIERGVELPDGQRVRAGIIGEIGSDLAWISAVEERCLRAAARAQLATGVAITTHASRGQVGLRQLDILIGEGVAANRIVIGHCDTTTNLAYHDAIAASGAYIQFDTIRERVPEDLAQRAFAIKRLLDRGHSQQVLLSQDVCMRQHLGRYGGNGYGFLLEVFVPSLREAGVSNDQIDQILRHNPARALARTQNTRATVSTE